MDSSREISRPASGPRATTTATTWLLRLAAFLLPLAEGGLELPIVAICVIELPPTIARFRAAAREPSESRGPEMLVAVGLVGWLVLGLVAVLVSGLSPRFSAVSKGIMTFAVLVGAFALARERQPELRRLLLLLLAGTGVAIAAGLSQYSTGSFPGESLLLGAARGWRGQLYIAGTTARAVTGTLLNRLKMAEALLFSASALAAVAFTVRRLLWRLLALVGLALVVLSLYLTSVKAAMLGLGVALVAVTLMSLWPRLCRWVPLAAGAGFVGGALFVVSSALTSPVLANAPDGSYEVRVWIWQHALLLLRERPWLGSGIGTYETASGPVFKYVVEVWRTTAHNHHLTVLIEGGIVGFAFWLVALLGLVLGVRRCWQRSVGELGRDAAGLRVCATSYVVALMVLSFLHDIFWHPGTAVMFWLCVGVLLALGRSPSTTPPSIA